MPCNSRAKSIVCCLVVLSKGIPFEFQQQNQYVFAKKFFIIYHRRLTMNMYEAYMYGIYREIAKDNNTTVREVKREIERAIKCAYLASEKDGIFKNGVPTNEEFIKKLTEKSKNP
jgi:hypothetical protein